MNGIVALMPLHVISYEDRSGRRDPERHSFDMFETCTGRYTGILVPPPITFQNFHHFFILLTLERIEVVTQEHDAAYMSVEQT